jgi:hypothetical protein
LVLKRKTLGHFQTNLIFMWTPEEAAGWLQEGQSVFPHDSVVSFSLVAPKESEQRIKVKQVLGEELRGPCDNVSLCPEPWLDHPVLDTSRSMLSELGTQLLEELWLACLIKVLPQLSVELCGVRKPISPSTPRPGGGMGAQEEEVKRVSP